MCFVSFIVILLERTRFNKTFVVPTIMKALKWIIGKLLLFKLLNTFCNISKLFNETMSPFILPVVNRFYDFSRVVGVELWTIYCFSLTYCTFFLRLSFAVVAMLNMILSHKYLWLEVNCENQTKSHKHLNHSWQSMFFTPTDNQTTNQTNINNNINNNLI